MTAGMGLEAKAVELSQKGQVAYLSGAIVDGDQFKLRDFLARPEAAQLRAIYLQSPGGRILPMKEMARSIRKAGLATVVDGSRGICSSACTGLFAAGVRRHYINTNAIVDGQKVPRGLGFHEGNAVGRSGRPEYAGVATAEMVNTYYEMGVSGAASLATKAGFRGMHFISGQTAMAQGIATSLSPP